MFTLARDNKPREEVFFYNVRRASQFILEPGNVKEWIFNVSSLWHCEMIAVYQKEEKF